MGLTIFLVVVLVLFILGLGWVGHHMRIEVEAQEARWLEGLD